MTLTLALGAYGAYVPAEADAAVTSGPTGGVAASVEEAPELTPAQIAAAVADFKQSGQPYDTFTSDGQRYISVKFASGSTLNLPDSGPAVAGQRVVEPPRGVAPQLGAGGGIGAPYVSFNRTDQAVLLGGGAAGLTVAICLIPGIGAPACVAATVIVTVAAGYVAAYGRCPTSRPNLRIHAYGWKRYLDGCYR